LVIPPPLLHAAAVDRRARSLLEAFVSKLGQPVEVTYYAGPDGPPRTVTAIEEVVTAFRPAAGEVEMVRHGVPVRLRFGADELLKALDVAERDAGATWGMPTEESAARFMTIWLMESVDTQESDSSGWWEFVDCGFRPSAGPAWLRRRGN
jgi:hypothetical protein